tara:strand:- start:6325 stop:8229 length:1905 start_codon:yes stop_codon:yes gene_type:complete
LALQKIIFKPGINREGTDYSNEGGWFNSNLVRFRKGLPEKIGGWTKNTTNTFKSTGRALHAWVSLAGTKFIGLGATWKYYILEGANFYDITPIRVTTGANEISFAKVANGDATLTVTDTAHGAVQNDFVTYSGCVSLGGNITANVLNQEYQIATIVNSNSYTIEAKDTNGDEVTAAAGDSGDGQGTIIGAYQINVGLDVYAPSTGWGVGTWGSGTFGSSSALDFSNQLRLWSHDNFGEDLVINPRMGGVYYWDTSAKTLGTDRAVALSDLSGANLAPTKALQVLVSDIDRHVICFGADPLNDGGTARTGTFDPMFIAWSDQENITEWEPKATNTAGSFRLSAGSAIVGATRARQETLIWTDTSLYSMSFVGQPFTFSVNLVNEGVGLVGPNAMINTPKGIFWMDKKGFYTYGGNIQQLQCSVDAYVFGDLNQTQNYQIFGFVNKAFDEVGWFYCSGESTVLDRYVVYNYEEGTWVIGNLTRTCWLDEGIYPDPKATYSSSDVGYLYDHETGNDADGSAMTDVFIESSDFDIDPAGDQFQFISKIIPDIKFTGSGSTGTGGQTAEIVLKKRNYPGEDLTTAVTGSCTSNTTKIDTRVRGRQAVLRIQSNDDNTSKTGMSFRVGAMRLDIKPDGMR